MKRVEMSIKSEYVESKRAHDDAMAKYDARIADLDIQGRINRATTIEELSTIEARVNDLSRDRPFNGETREQRDERRAGV